jgi:hypothetical protein
MAKQNFTYKTKQIDGRHAMICMNSNPAESKYAYAAPQDGPCEEWVFCGNDTAKVLCSSCVQRSLSKSPNFEPIEKTYED